MSGRKNTLRAKLKAACQKVRTQKRKKYFKNLLGNPPEICKPVTKIISKHQWTSIMGLFMEVELDAVQKKLKAVKLQAFTKYLLQYGRQEKFDDILVLPQNAVTKQNNREIDKWLHPPLKITQNYWSIISTAIDAKVYNTLLLNRIKPKIERLHWKNENVFWRNRSTIFQILTIRWIIERVGAKITGQYYCLLQIEGANTASIGSPKRNCHSENNAFWSITFMEVPVV